MLCLHVDIEIHLSFGFSDDGLWLLFGLCSILEVVERLLLIVWDCRSMLHTCVEIRLLLEVKWHHGLTINWIFVSPREVVLSWSRESNLRSAYQSWSCRCCRCCNWIGIVVLNCLRHVLRLWVHLLLVLVKKKKELWGEEEVLTDTDLLVHATCVWRRELHNRHFVVWQIQALSNLFLLLSISSFVESRDLDRFFILDYLNLLTFGLTFQFSLLLWDRYFLVFWRSPSWSRLRAWSRHLEVGILDLFANNLLLINWKVLPL